MKTNWQDFCIGEIEKVEEDFGESEYFDFKLFSFFWFPYLRDPQEFEIDILESYLILDWKTVPLCFISFGKFQLFTESVLIYKLIHYFKYKEWPST